LVNQASGEEPDRFNRCLTAHWQSGGLSGPPVKSSFIKDRPAKSFLRSPGQDRTALG